MNHRQPAPGQDQAAIGRAREGRDAPFDVGRVAHVDRAHIDRERGRRGLDGTPLAMPAVMVGSRITAARVTFGAICLSSSNHLPPMPNSYGVNPVTLPPGRARLSTNPAPTGSGTFVNTIGTVRVA